MYCGTFEFAQMPLVLAFQTRVEKCKSKWDLRVTADKNYQATIHCKFISLAKLLIFKFGTSRQVAECLTIMTPNVIGFSVL